ncbi:amidohydrolase [Bradyrhizobium sp. SK17]|jgi:predicted amidohydrolase YtcJ|uniref:amidohydrolase n=1 Tax=Bradyrhizobium sp. SK17 TaxID=2057741 RepID=UPI000C30D425|nr:amidohydrolase [Bradyrhizobium sp. SK17]AUC94862.1 amidohydrolase [Bradyrhizobium sp. SK17]
MVQPELIFHNGKVFTADAAAGRAEAMAVAGGTIVAVGSDLDVKSLAGPGTKMVDLGGGMLLPGIVDVHNHHLRGGQADLYELKLLPTMSFDAVLETVRARCATTKPGEWVFGGIWGSQLVEMIGRASSLAALDAVSGAHPVMLRDDSQHNRWVNSRALELIGIDDGTRDPQDGQILRDAETGAATGLLLERASGLAEQAVERSIPDIAERNKASCRRAVEILNGFGVTAFQDATTTLPFLEALAALDRANELNGWCVASLPGQRTLSGADLVGDALIMRRETYRTRHVRPDFIKLFMDGVPTTRTAAMLTPYRATRLQGCCFCGDPLISIPDLVRWIAKAEKHRMRVKVHCTGDAAVRDTLDAIDVVRSFNGPGNGAGATHQIAHAGFVAPADIPRFRALDVAADLSPIIWYPGPIQQAIRAAMPEDRADCYWPLRDFRDAGALMAAGSDWPVVANPDPWLGIEGMITRRNPRGGYDGALWPEQALDLETVLRIYTINAARAMGLSDLTGSIEAGKSADFILVDRDLFATAPERLSQTKVLSTWFEGRQVHEAG